jgi:hypothetical protein
VPTPAAVTGLSSGVTQISSAGSRACAVVAGGVQCWGALYVNQGSVAGTAISDHPVAITGLASGVAEVSAATCARTIAGALICWGPNGDGQLGDGTLVDRAEAMVVPGLETGVSDVAVKGEDVCVVASADVKCLGSDEFGQLGDGGSQDSAVPLGVLGLGRGTIDPPSQPGSLAVSRTDHSASLDWTAPADDGGSAIYGYKVMLLTSDGATATDVIGAQTRVTSDTSFEFDGLTTATPYRFEVTPLNLAGMGRAALSTILPSNVPTTTTTSTSTSTSTTTTATSTSTTTSTSTPTTSTSTSTSVPRRPPPPQKPKHGYWLASSTGRVYVFGQMANYGAANTSGVTHIEATPTNHGYWLVNASGRVFAFGDARHLAGSGALAAGERVVGL